MQKTALVTGASRGIGRACAWAFHKAGYRVVINYHQSAEKALALERAIKEDGGAALAVKADVADPRQVEDMAKKACEAFDGVDALVCNAGVGESRLITDVSAKDWDDMFAVNVKGAFLCVKSVLPGMIAKKSGSIVLMSSIWGLVGASCEVCYSASKAALLGFMKALSKEVGPSGIRVNAVAPGVIETDMLHGLSQSELSALREETPLGVLGAPQDVAQAVLYLAGERAGFVTGQVLSPNGGFLIT